MRERIFEGRLSDEIAHGDRGYRERLKAAARLLVGIIRDGLVRDGHVRIHGFGSFRLRPMKARTGVNPRTGERIAIPARQRVLFRPAKALRGRIEPARPRARPIAEPHPSREATLGTGAFEVARPWGTVPSAEGAPGARARRTPGAAGAAGGDEEPHASREATLGGTMQDPHAAGALPPAADEADVAGADDAAPPPGASGPPAGDDGARVAAAAVAEPGARTHEAAAGEGAHAPADTAAGVPGGRQAGDAAATRVAAATAGVGPGAFSTAAEERAGAERRGAGRWGTAALLVALLALLLWWLWPVERPQPQVAEAPATGAGSAGPAADTGAAEGAAAPADGAGDAGDASAAGEAATEVQPPEAPAAAAERPADEAPAPVAIPDGPAAVAGADTDTEAHPATAASAGVEDSTGDGGPAVAGDAGDAAPAGDAPAVASVATPEPGARADTEGTAATTTSPGGEGAAESPHFRAREYTVARGDTLWGLAARHYGDAYLWPHIWNHNEGLSDPDRIRVEQSLWLPALEGGPQDLGAGDRRSIAEGYLRLYRFYRERGRADPRDALVAARRFDASVLPEGLRRSGADRAGAARAAAHAPADR